MKKVFLFFLLLLLLLSCQRNPESVLENQLDVRLPQKFIILKDTVVIQKKMIRKMDIQYTKNQINLLIHKLKRKEKIPLKKFDKGYELSFLNTKTQGNIIIKIDTINNHFLYREYHF